MSIIPAKIRAPRVLLAAALCALAACGGDRPRAAASADSTAAAPADTTAMGTARQYLGDQVRRALRFELPNRPRRFIAAAIPVTERVDDPLRAGVSVAPGGHEVVILELVQGGANHAITKPGLYASDLPGMPGAGSGTPAMPDSGALAHMMGVEDLNGDGDPEVWTVQYGGPRHPYTWEMRAFDRGGPALFQLAMKQRNGGPDDRPELWDASKNLRDDDAMYASMQARITALQARFPTAGAAPDSFAAAAEAAR